jgi:hypothetical protein
MLVLNIAFKSSQVLKKYFTTETFILISNIHINTTPKLYKGRILKIIIQQIFGF